jgi:hypothetical protein
MARTRTITPILKQAFVEAGSKGLSPIQLHRYLKERGSKAEYSTSRKLIYALRVLGLIRLVRRKARDHQPSGFEYQRFYHMVDPDDPLWLEYPMTALRKHYATQKK